MALGYEVTQNRLLQQRRMMRAHRLRRREHIHHLRWNDEVSEPQGREHYRAKAARENHDAGSIESLQRWNRPAGESIFAFIVVFKDETPRLPRPIQQCEAPPQAHRDT